MAEDRLAASVAAGQSGPVIILSGEADLASAARLNALISAQLAGGTQELTVDVSGLSFADSSSIRALVRAARTLQQRGGRLVLLNPQQAVTLVLTLLCVDQMLTILAETGGAPPPYAEPISGEQHSAHLRRQDRDQ